GLEPQGSARVDAAFDRGGPQARQLQAVAGNHRRPPPRDARRGRLSAAGRRADRGSQGLPGGRGGEARAIAFPRGPRVGCTEADYEDAVNPCSDRNVGTILDFEAPKASRASDDPPIRRRPPAPSPDGRLQCEQVLLGRTGGATPLAPSRLRD